MLRMMLAALPIALWLAVPAHADDYDNALRCLTYIEIAKDDYTGSNIDALRAASEKMVAWADSSRPADLTDQEKIDRLSAAIDGVQKEGGLSTQAGRQAAIDCAGYFDIELVLPE